MVKNLTEIQAELRAPKSQYNDFGKYHYRNAEDILQAVKPLLQKYRCQLTISDDIIAVGDRIYVKAICTITDQDGNTETVTVFAREASSKKGMDDSQVTGTASSYARKYALNGLFLIDDTKDADTNQFRQQQDASKITPEFLQSHGQETITAREVDLLILALNRSGKTMDQALNACKVREPLRITYCQFAALMAQCG
jgi:hypothetical protein